MEFFIYRVVCFFVGGAMALHALCSAGFAPGKDTPKAVILVIGCGSGAGVGMVFAALEGSPTLYWLTLAGACSMWAEIFLLWLYDGHLSEFVLNENKLTRYVKFLKAKWTNG